MLVLITQPRIVFTSAHASLVEALREPFSAALENDLRLREMAAMCAAAEADKQSLLTRLGRKDLGDTVVGANSGLQHVIERVGLVARSDCAGAHPWRDGHGKRGHCADDSRRSRRGPTARFCGSTAGPSRRS